MQTRVNFLNKLYQCLMASRMPHKVRKLVVAGPKDSGKTSWASIFHRLIPPGNIASITNERHFSAAMITAETQLVLVDEWSVDTIQSDLAKTILQGGWMVTAVKHEIPRCVMNNSPFYITTNTVPNFGVEDDNVKRRIEVFETTSLPITIPGVDRWIYDHAMDCVAWMAEEITTNIALVDNDELWYTNGDERSSTIGNNEYAKLFDAQKLRLITHFDLDEPTRETQHPSPSAVVHERFATESRNRRLARKRRAQNRLISSSDEDSCQNESVVKPSDTGHDDDFLKEEFGEEENNSTEEVDLHEAVREQEQCRARDAREPIDQPGTSAFCPPEVIPTSDDVGDEGQVLDDDEDCLGSRVSTPNEWTMNDPHYLDKVHELVKKQFYGIDMSAAHVHSFTARLKNAPRHEKSFWTKVDPKIDAWMLVIGKVRDVLRLDALISKHPDFHRYLAHFRQVVNVRILPSSCPAYKAWQKLNSNADPEEGDGEEATAEPQRRPQLSSQSYWTTIKKWAPW